MARTLIGSSNIYRFDKPETFTGYKRYKMVACTSMEVFRVAMDELENNKGGVVISVVENFICKAIRGSKEPDAIVNLAKEAINQYLGVVKTVATKHPELKFALVLPILRPKEAWYTENHSSIVKWIGDGIKTMDLGNVSKINSSVETTQQFESDGVHLTMASGKVFIDAILFYSEDYIRADLIDLESEGAGGGMEVDNGDILLETDQAKASNLSLS